MYSTYGINKATSSCIWRYITHHTAFCFVFLLAVILVCFFRRPISCFLLFRVKTHHVPLTHFARRLCNRIVGYIGGRCNINSNSLNSRSTLSDDVSGLDMRLNFSGKCEAVDASRNLWIGWSPNCQRVYLRGILWKSDIRKFGVKFRPLFISIILYTHRQFNIGCFPKIFH